MPTIPNKRSLTIAVTLDPNYPPMDNGAQAAQFFHIPESQHYTGFSIQVVAGAGILDSISGNIAGGLAVNGEPGANAGEGVVNDGLALATNYVPIHVLSPAGNNAATVITASGGTEINTFEVPTHLKGGIVLGLTGLDANGTIHVCMSNSKYSASL